MKQAYQHLAGPVIAATLGLITLVVWLSGYYAPWFDTQYDVTWSPTMARLTALMVAWVGACVGSFLNVVIWRLPRGRSIVHGGSACPQCGHAIAARDNVPVLSWLWLRGRCRHCQHPIAAQYPLVELAIATVFVIVTGVYLWPPRAELTEAWGSVGVRQWAEDRWFQAALTIHWLCLLFAGAKMVQDGQELPRVLIRYAIVVQLAAVVIYGLWRTWHVESIDVVPTWLQSWHWPSNRGEGRDPFEMTWMLRFIGLWFGWTYFVGGRKNPPAPQPGWLATGTGWGLTGWTIGALGLLPAILLMLASSHWTRGRPIRRSWSFFIAILAATIASGLITSPR
ncbi:MAG: prepilin peptidase [Pirellulales bacterium]